MLICTIDNIILFLIKQMHVFNWNLTIIKVLKYDIEKYGIFEIYKTNRFNYISLCTNKNVNLYKNYAIEKYISIIFELSGKNWSRKDIFSFAILKICLLYTSPSPRD